MIGNLLAGASAMLVCAPALAQKVPGDYYGHSHVDRNHASESPGVIPPPPPLPNEQAITVLGGDGAVEPQGYYPARGDVPEPSTALLLAAGSLLALRRRR